MIASGSNDSSGEIFLTPYTALTLAEYFRDQGKDVLLVIDDMTTHAKYYRELSLLSRKFPGRDSYPGDVFHIHSKLLERAGSFEKGSITCLPLAETQMGDMAGYIQTNLMSMTDGHIYFDTSLFLRGAGLPLILFVSYPCWQANPDAFAKDITKRLLQALSDYEKTSRFVKFGTELGENSRAVLDMGEKIWQLFDQPINEIVPLPLAQVLFVLLAIGNFEPKNTQKAIENYDEKKIITLLDGCSTVDQLIDKINKENFKL